jgi:acetate kinase
VAASATTLGGLYALALTGGIGEHHPEITDRICRRLDWLGVRIHQGTSRAGHATAPIA